LGEAADEGREEAGAPRGRDRFVAALLLALLCLAFAVLLQIALYARPAPHGGPFLADWQRYFWLALYYEMLGIWLVSAPFFLVWLALFRRSLGARGWAWLVGLQAALLAFYLLLSAADHELLRFLGVRLNFSFLQAYGGPALLTDGMFLDVIGADRGGAYLPLLLVLLIPLLYLWLAYRLARLRPSRTPALWAALLLALVPLAAPANGWRMATGEFRLRKIEPVVIAFATDLAAGFHDLREPADFAQLAAAHRRDWLARSADPGWRFPDPERPYLREPTVPFPPAPSGPRWNVIYIQLETLRGVDVGFLNPSARASPTPYLDSLAGRPDAAVWTRASSFGMPSINGVFATHCSITPPSQRYITALTHVEFLCLPELLRAHGYRTEIFHGDDTDWDNSTLWFRRWYDRFWNYDQAGRRDRPVFRAAAQRIRALGRSGRPFFATVVSVSNHTPFTSVDPATDVAGHDSPAERILNTTHYTDDVVRELIEALRNEPWFGRTLIVITGDHGFNLGEHGQAAGQHNLYRESLWVPLMMLGRHPRLRPGVHADLVSHLDLTPTLADLLGLRVANPWQGHSLLALRGGGLAFGFRESLVAENQAWTAVRDPSDGSARLYRTGEDWLQRRDLAARRPAIAAALLARAERMQRLNDYLLRNDRVWRD
jgi:Sulfatase